MLFWEHHVHYFMCLIRWTARPSSLTITRSISHLLKRSSASFLSSLRSQEVTMRIVISIRTTKSFLRAAKIVRIRKYRRRWLRSQKQIM